MPDLVETGQCPVSTRKHFRAFNYTFSTIFNGMYKTIYSLNLN